jgi:pyruvate,water dikinase
MDKKTAPLIVQALRDTEDNEVIIPKKQTGSSIAKESQVHTKPRQLIGQPAAAGLISGMAYVVRSIEDLGQFKAGEILVCEAIQPSMTHLVPLAGAIIEQRGGMLIHGAIIAREMGIPCVNGVSNAADVIKTGELVTVDGHLGIVTVGEPEFDLEINP